MKTKKYFILLGVFAALLMIVTPGLVMAGAYQRCFP